MNKLKYKIKPNIKFMISKQTTQNDLSKKVGISKGYMNEILNNNKRRTGISPSLAYFICKAISPDLEIEDIFEEIKK